MGKAAGFMVLGMSGSQAYVKEGENPRGVWTVTNLGEDSVEFIEDPDQNDLTFWIRFKKAGRYKIWIKYLNAEHVVDVQ